MMPRFHDSSTGKLKVGNRDLLMHIKTIKYKTGKSGQQILYNVSIKSSNIKLVKVGSKDFIMLAKIIKY